MGSRVLLLGELVVLMYADFAAIYSKTHDTGLTLAQLPRVGSAAFLVWALLFFAADTGYGSIAATFGGLIVLSFFIAFYALIIDTLTSFVNGGVI